MDIKKKKILICDDEEGIRESLKLILENDYDLIFSQNGDEAVQNMRTNRIDITILDIKMPKKDGLETLKELMRISPSSKVVIATGYKSVDIAREAMNIGAIDYIVKPFDRDKIKKIVQKHI